MSRAYCTSPRLKVLSRGGRAEFTSSQLGYFNPWSVLYIIHNRAFIVRSILHSVPESHLLAYALLRENLCKMDESHMGKFHVFSFFFLFFLLFSCFFLNVLGSKYWSNIRAEICADIGEITDIGINSASTGICAYTFGYPRHEIRTGADYQYNHRCLHG